ncbi:FAD-dependent oxidoreductase [Methylomonas sp. AM2-LC]|uniref:NAD(P)/FAD-dependent oxidoreductase n=1 Tax=Methylomonas sp. AM2-LC TaxID=3153301 RepID=UPI003264CB7A
MKQKLVVIGNGMAGMKTVEELLQSAPDKYSITVFGAEPYGNYNRILLSAVLSGEKNMADIIINNKQWYDDNGLQLHAGHDKAVVSIERGLRKVVARDGTVAEYDRLLIATGSKPVVPDIPGINLTGVIGFRDILDVNTMLSYCETHQQAVVLGGGLLGLEAANGLLQRGMDVTVIHNNEILLNRQLDRQAGQMLQSNLENRGVKFKMSAQISHLVGNAEQHIQTVYFSDGSQLPCDLLIMAIGVQPDISLAKRAGLYCERGIVVNDTLQTYDPCVYAVGECIQHRGATFGLVAPLFEQAKVCANHLSAHGMAEYVTLPTATKLKVTGIQLFSVGNFLGDEQCEQIHYNDVKQGIYKKLIVKHNQLQGAVLYGDTALGSWYQELIEQKTNIADQRQALIFGGPLSGNAAAPSPV